MREGGRGTAGGSIRRFRAQHIFVIVQVALALVLMVGAGLLTRSFRAQLGIDTGSELEPVAAMRMQLPRSRYADQEAIQTFASEIERRASEMPGISSASISNDLPFRGGSSGAYVYRQDAPDDRIRFHMHAVSEGYFETLGIRVVEGRSFTPEDVESAPSVGVITQAMVRRVFPEGGAIGRTMFFGSGGQNPFEIVGVIEDLRYRNLTTSLMAEGNSPDVFFPYAQLPTRTIEVAVRADGDPSVIGPVMRRMVAEIDPDLPVFQVQPLMTSYNLQMSTPRFAAFLMGLFSTFAAVLACVGIYGVLSFAVGQRSQEIAIRRAIGASAPSVARTVVGDGLKLVIAGLFVGSIGAVTGSRVLRAFLFEVEATDPLTFVAVGGTMVSVALVAAIIPAVRAARRDPAGALSAE
jgi:putative ABC transport system permease protein